LILQRFTQRKNIADQFGIRQIEKTAYSPNIPAVKPAGPYFIIQSLPRHIYSNGKLALTDTGICHDTSERPFNHISTPFRCNFKTMIAHRFPKSNPKMRQKEKK
jgi:hypothetical protein